MKPIPLKKDERIISIRFLDPIPEINADFYVNSKGEIIKRPLLYSPLQNRKINKSYIKCQHD